MTASEHPKNQRSLFEADGPSDAAAPESASDARMPVAARMRPRTLEEIVGQEHIIGPGKVLRRAIESDHVPSMILWGPPGTGKTTLAEVIAGATHAWFIRLSAVTAGVAELRKAVETANERRKAYNQRTILFIDEIHRFNKAQQDAVLPHVERGVVILIGATTENPSFEVNAALLSRSRVFTLKALTDAQIETIIQRALDDAERGLGRLQAALPPDALSFLAVSANGDARTALNALELAADAVEPDASGQRVITIAAIEGALQHRALLYDKAGEEHYNLISALHKALRGSDPDAGLYWLGRMLEAGEDPLYIVRRLIRFASEDVGMADPQALVVAVAAQQAVHFIGMPEGKLALAQLVVHLATAPKSNALYLAYGRVEQDVQQTRSDPVPLWIRNAPTQLMKDLDYSKGYIYSHDVYQQMATDDPTRPPPEALQAYLPDNLKGRRYYEPTPFGEEGAIKDWLEKRRQRQDKPPEEQPEQAD
ncbi:MAG TPA: replication-associated recombination protein A [Ktedonobacterales bacterium]|nr:replication-associated recombination protein A [Ktedonobacterales bacterium]